MTTMLQHPLYFRRYGVRLPAQLAAPRIFPISALSLPRGTMLHYISESKTEYGPASDDILLQNVTRLIFVDHVVELTSRQGNPRSAYVQPAPLIQGYRRKYHKLRLLNKLELADREPQNLLIANYGLLPHLYKYIRSAFAIYYTWSNIQATMWDTINTRMRDTKRNHYVTLELPDVLPSLIQLRKAEKNQTRETLKTFTSNGALGLLDLWMWVGKNRQNSLITRVKKTDLDRVNFIVSFKGYWLTINLGVLDGWRADEEPGSKGLSPEMLQLRLLKMLTSLIESGTSLDDGKTDKTIQQVPSNDPSLIAADEQDDVSEDDVAKQLSDLSEFDEDEIKDFEVLTNDLETSDSDNEFDDGTVYDEDGNVIEDAPKEGLPPSVEGLVIADRSLDSAIKLKADSLADRGLLSGAEYRRLYKLAEGYKTIKDPYGSGMTLEESAVINPEDLVVVPDLGVPDIPEVIDKSMLSSTVSNIDKQYVDKIMNKDILNSVLAIQHAGIAVTGYSVERVVDAVSDFEVHAITVQPAVGRQSTIRFRLPKVQPNGMFISNGAGYRLRKQRTELPIVKVNPTRVALTSYYSKLFVEKSDRAVFNYDRWVANQVVAAALSHDNPHIGDIRISKVADNSVRTPRIYSALAERCAGFTIKRDDWRTDLPNTVNWKEFVKNDDKHSLSMVMNFDYNNRFKSGMFDKAHVEKLERSKQYIVVGRVGSAYVVIDYNDVFYVNNNGELHVVGRLEDILDIPMEKAPAAMAELKIFSKSIPIGVVLSYLLGFSNLIKLLGITPRRVANGQRTNLMPDEFAVRFLDETLIFQKDDVKASLVFSGFNLYHATIRNYSVYSFDKRDVYLNILDAYGIGVRFLRELDLMNAMWIDPITQSLLEQMGEPTNYTSLLLRAVELLVTRYVPTQMENAAAGFDGLERARGYERFAGVVYAELVKSIRTYNTRTATSTASLSMHPHDVWTQITQDPAAELVNEANPIHNIKEKEVITFGGRGGRSQRSMVAEHRLFKKSDMGFISEATVDSGQVAIITYLSPNANFTNVRGTVRTYDKDRDGSTTLLSTAALLAPGADRDDPKRVNFINIQQTHGISAKGYRPTPLRTGYEQVLAHRTDEQFAKAAEQDGKVLEVSDKHIKVENADGTITALELGRYFGTSAGTVLPNDLTTVFKVGDVVKKGDILVYSEGFFEPHTFNKKQVVWKAGVIAKTAIMEASFTLEDSSAITERLARELGTQITKVKTVTVRFDQTVRNLVQAGDATDLDTILCTIEDSVTANNDLFDEESLSYLRLLSAMTPRAKTVGKVEKIEVFYHGDIEDMSESLQELAVAGDRERKRQSRKLNKPTVTGSVDQSLRIDGNGLDLDTMAIRVYITTDVGTGIGDKAVFANQMKTVIGRVLEGVHETESGKPFDAIFGFKSIQDRIVLSPMIIGTTNTLLRVIGENAADIYFGKK
jgi:hypothetical protein